MSLSSTKRLCSHKEVNWKFSIKFQTNQSQWSISCPVEPHVWSSNLTAFSVWNVYLSFQRYALQHIPLVLSSSICMRTTKWHCLVKINNAQHLESWLFRNWWLLIVVVLLLPTSTVRQSNESDLRATQKAGGEKMKPRQWGSLFIHYYLASIHPSS